MFRTFQGYGIGASKVVGLAAFLLIGPGLGCGFSQAPAAGEPRGAETAPTPGPSDTASARALEPSPGSDERPRMVFLGTSLTAGLGLDPAQAYPALIQQKLDAAGLRYQVINAGVSGETSAGALRRIDWLLHQPIAVLVVETGANDGLRGQDPDQTRENIRRILERVRALEPRPKLLLLGMKALPNYGLEYARRFEAVYPELARKYRIPLVPFLLEGVAGVSTLNQPDGIHPTAEGQQRVAETVWRELRPLLAPRKRR
jgi:acyl-CoA thioesterase-1